MNYKDVKYKALDFYCKWVFGNFIHSERMAGLKVEFMINDCVIRPETLCRWTGFYDINKVGIYDNDTVIDEFGTIGVVKWLNDGQSACFVVEWNDGDICGCFNDAAHLNLKVIGNLFN